MIRSISTLQVCVQRPRPRTKGASAADGTNLPPNLTQAINLPLLVEHNVKKTLEAIGGIRASNTRDFEMAKVMAERYNTEWSLFAMGPLKLAK